MRDRKEIKAYACGIALEYIDKAQYGNGSMYFSKNKIVTAFAVSLVVPLLFRIIWIEPEISKITDILKESNPEKKRNKEEIVLDELKVLTLWQDAANVTFFSLGIGGVIVLLKRNQKLLEVNYANNCEIQSLEQVKQERMRMIAAVAHDVRAYCSPIVTFAELLERFGDSHPDKTKEWIEQIIQSVYRIKSLSDDMILVSQAQKNQPKELVECRLDEIAKSVISRWNSPLHIIFFMAKGDNRPIKLNQQLCDRAIYNLIQNAIKYSPSGGHIHVLVDLDEPSIVIADQGIGIPEGVESQLFEAFSRLDNVGSIPGLGLGLFIVDTCAKEHGGNVQISRDITIGDKVFKTALKLTLQEGVNGPSVPEDQARLSCHP